MSATIGNSEEIAEWLDATLIKSDHGRGIPIEEHGIENKQGDEKITRVADTVDAHREKAPFLIFNSSRSNAEARAEKLSERGIFDDVSNRNFRAELRDQLDRRLTRQLERLAVLMEAGVAYHHAGLPYQVKQLIEEAFVDGDLMAISATTTVAYGFDSPVRSVLIADLNRWNGSKMDYIPPFEFRQMRGRAARPGHGYDQGHLFAIYSDYKDLHEKYFDDPDLNPITSHLDSDEAFRWLMLELVGTNWQTADEIESFVSETLYWEQASEGVVHSKYCS